MFSIGLIFILSFYCNKWSSFKGLPSVELTKVHCAAICSWIIDHFDVNLYKDNYFLFLLKSFRLCLDVVITEARLTSLVNLSLTDFATAAG